MNKEELRQKQKFEQLVSIQLKEEFYKVDYNNDGTLSKQELFKFLDLKVL